jgi:hypothetical protein
VQLQQLPPKYSTSSNSSIEALDYQGRLREFEQKAGANWLHAKKVLEFTKG